MKWKTSMQREMKIKLRKLMRHLPVAVPCADCGEVIEVVWVEGGVRSVGDTWFVGTSHCPACGAHNLHCVMSLELAEQLREELKEDGFEFQERMKVGTL